MYSTSETRRRPSAKSIAGLLPVSSEAILDECYRNVAAQRPDIPAEALARTRALMNRAVPDCLVTG
jgi:hypothetical protein